MGLKKELPLSFFEKTRQNAPKNSPKDVIPFKWTNEKEILSGKNKEKVIVELPKSRSITLF